MAAILKFSQLSVLYVNKPDNYVNLNFTVEGARVLIS